MAEKLTWSEIKERYRNEFVQLVDYEWDETEPDPRSGVVTIHSKNRREFDQLIRQAQEPDSAILYVGEINLPKGVTLSANQNQYFRRSA